MKTNLLLILFTVALCSCVSTSIIPISEINNIGIPLYFTKLPQSDYDEIAFIEASGGNGNLHKIITLFNDRVKEANGDAVISVRISKIGNAYYISGIVIKFKKI